MLSKDGWGGLAVAAASLLLFWGTLRLPDNPLVPIGPGFYPRIILGLTAVLGLWLFVSDFLRSRRRPPSAGDAKPPAPIHANYLAVAIQFGVFGLYVGLLSGLGFRLSTFLYVAVANALMDPPKGWRGWLRVLVLAAATSAITFVVFERYLQVLLPRGRWSGF